jgi:pyridoxal phosphate enzyme (YggS family)
MDKDDAGAAAEDPAPNSSPSHRLLREDADRWRHVETSLRTVQQKIALAAARARRDPTDVQLVAVSKGMPIDALRAAVTAGQRTFGENRVQEALTKIDALNGRGIEWHLIGHLQRNKAKAATAFDMIESVDSVRIAAALDSHLDSPQSILLEVNVASEASKTGLAPEQLPATMEAIQGMTHLCVEGLMTIAPLVADAEVVRPVFRRLRELRDTHGLRHLSMGMTNDYTVAIEEGATHVRIGRAIFGER